jgi:hypothetical protein
MVTHSNTIIKFADDTTVVGLITGYDETAYREEVSDLAVWGRNSIPSVNVSKTMKQIVDYRNGGLQSSRFRTSSSLVSKSLRT